MSNKKLGILAVIAVFMLLWAVIQSRLSNRTSSGTSGPTYLIQGLDTAEIDSIVIGKGDDALTFKRQNNGFVVVNKDNYPAVTREINSIISDLLDITTSQLITDNPANHKDLEVTQESAYTVVKLFKADSTLLTGTLVGTSPELGQGSYIRLANQDKVYLTTGNPWFSTTATDYIDTSLLSVLKEKIASVTVQSDDGQYTLTADANSIVPVLENIPEGKQAIADECEAVFTALSSLRFNDVMAKTGDIRLDSQYICRLKDTTVYTISIGRQDDKAYINCVCDFLDTTSIEASADATDEEKEKQKEKLIAWENAEAFVNKHRNWIYEISATAAENLTKPLSELIEDTEEIEDTPSIMDLIDPNEMPEFLPEPNNIN